MATLAKNSIAFLTFCGLAYKGLTNGSVGSSERDLNTNEK